MSLITNNNVLVCGMIKGWVTHVPLFRVSGVLAICELCGDSPPTRELGDDRKT